MKKSLLLLIVFLTLLMHSQAQHKKHAKPRKKKISNNYVSLGVGGFVPLGYMGVKKPADVLVGSDMQTYVKVVSQTIFIRKGFGVEWSLFANRAQSDPFGRFSKEMHETYGKDHAISKTTGTYGRDNNVSLKLMAGPVYRIPKGRFLLVPKLMFGTGMNNRYVGYATLQRMDNNDIIDKYYKATGKGNEAFLISPSFTATFRLVKWLHIGIDVGYYWMRSRNEFEETTYNYSTKTENSTSYFATTIRHSIGIGGAIFWNIP